MSWVYSALPWVYGKNYALMIPVVLSLQEEQRGDQIHRKPQNITKSPHSARHDCLCNSGSVADVDRKQSGGHAHDPLKSH